MPLVQHFLSKDSLLPGLGLVLLPHPCCRKHFHSCLSCLSRSLWNSNSHHRFSTERFTYIISISPYQHSYEIHTIICEIQLLAQGNRLENGGVRIRIWGFLTQKIQSTASRVKPYVHCPKTPRKGMPGVSNPALAPLAKPYLPTQG